MHLSLRFIINHTAKQINPHPREQNNPGAHFQKSRELLRPKNILASGWSPGETLGYWNFITAGFLVSWRSTTDQRTWGLWVQDCCSLWIAAMELSKLWLFYLIGWSLWWRWFFFYHASNLFILSYVRCVRTPNRPFFPSCFEPHYEMRGQVQRFCQWELVSFICKQK